MPLWLNLPDIRHKMEVKSLLKSDIASTLAAIGNVSVLVNNFGSL